MSLRKNKITSPANGLYEHDKWYVENGFSCPAGVDEAGRGPLAGPVVAAAVVLKGEFIDGIDDSKKLTPKIREHLFWEILCRADAIGIGIVDSEEIDRINILKATKKAMHAAIEDLRVLPDILLIDAIKIPDIKTEQAAIIKGDSKSASIAAASIVAKVTRDRLMLYYDRLYPHYGFKSHKGYPTKEHIKRIEEFNPCPIHRMSYAPVRRVKLPFE